MIVEGVVSRGSQQAGNGHGGLINARLAGLTKYCIKPSVKALNRSTSNPYSHDVVVTSGQCNPMVIANGRG